MHPQQTYLALCGLSAAVAFSAGLGAFRQRRTAAAGAPLAVVMGGLAWWSGLLLAEAALPDGQLRETVTLLTLPAFPGVAAGFTGETRALLDGGGHQGTRRPAVVLLSLAPLATAVLAVTNPLHHLLARVQPGSRAPWLAWVPGPGFWLLLAYTYLLLTWCFAQLTRALLSTSGPLQRRQLRSILLAAALPAAGSLLTLGHGSRQVAADLTPLFVLLAGLAHYNAVFRQGLPRLLPVARGLVLEHVGDAIFVMDTAGRVVDLNPAARLLALRLYPDLPRDLVGLPARLLLPHREQRRSLSDGLCHVRCRDSSIDLDLRVTDLADSRGKPLGRVVVARDVTELNRQRRTLEQQLAVIEALRSELAEIAVRDDLTGLHNRRHLLARLEEGLGAARADAHPLSVILLDIDHFKLVNDRSGHAVGDALLVATGRALADGVRASDTVARYGGEEFVVLMPGASAEEALHLAEALRARVATVHVDSRQGPVSTTISAGVATFPQCGWSAAELLASADDALYAAKRAGRDRVHRAMISVGAPDRHRFV